MLSRVSLLSDFWFWRIKIPRFGAFFRSFFRSIFVSLFSYGVGLNFCGILACNGDTGVQLDGGVVLVSMRPVLQCAGARRELLIL